MVLVLVPIAVIAVALLAMSLQNSSQQTTHYTLAESLRGCAGQIAGWLDQVPFVGRLLGSAIARTASDLADGIDAAAASIERHVAGWANQMVQPLADFVHAIVNNGYVLWEGSVNAIEEVAGAADRIVTQHIPDAINTSYRLASELANNVLGESQQYTDSHIQGAFAGMNAILNAQIGNVTGELTTIGDEIAATTLTLERQITDTALGLGHALAQAESTLQSAIAAEAGRAESIEALLGQHADQAAAEALREAEGIIHGAEQAARTDSLAREAAIAAAAAAATAAVAIDFTNFMDECGRDLCNGLGPFSRLIPEILGLIETGALLAVVAECALHPEEAASVAVDVLTPIVDEAHGLLSAVGIG